MLHERLREGQRECFLFTLHEPLPEGCQSLDAGRGWTLERRLRQLARDDANLRALSASLPYHGIARMVTPGPRVSREAARGQAHGDTRLTVSAMVAGFALLLNSPVLTTRSGATWMSW